MTRHLHLAHPAEGETDQGLPATRVALAVHHAMMRRGLQVLLESEAGIEVVAIGRDPGSIELLMEESCPDVLVLDLRIAGGSSLGAIHRFRELSPSTAIVAITMEATPGFARRAFDAGATGFVLKDSADADLPEAIRRAARGQWYESPRLSRSGAPV
jgi:DNA-binding NarL/FixJ family response regulator